MSDKILTEAFDKLKAIEESGGDFDSTWTEIDKRLRATMSALNSLREQPTMSALTVLEMQLEKLPRLGEELHSAIVSGMSDDEQDDFYNEGKY